MIDLSIHNRDQCMPVFIINRAYISLKDYDNEASIFLEGTVGGFSCTQHLMTMPTHELQGFSSAVTDYFSGVADPRSVFQIQRDPDTKTGVRLWRLEDDNIVKCPHYALAHVFDAIETFLLTKAGNKPNEYEATPTTSH